MKTETCPYCSGRLKIINDRWFCESCGYLDEGGEDEFLDKLE